MQGSANKHSVGVSDKRLVRDALADRHLAREALVRRLECVPAMLRARNRRSANALSSADLDDGIQECLTTIWTKLPTYEGRSSLETWIFGFCVRQLAKLRERRFRAPTALPENEEALPSAPESPLPDAWEFVHLGVDRLGPPADQVVRLKHFEELTFDQIAERLDVSANTAKTWYYRGLDRLREHLRPQWEREHMQ